MRALAARTFFLGLVTSLAHAQCATTWQGGASLAGTDGIVQAMAQWDPDGAGPLPTRLVLGGAFRVASNVVAHLVAVYDPATLQWSALPPVPTFSPDHFVRSIAALPNGDLVVGLAGFGGYPYSPLAFRWDGATWTVMGYGNGVVNDLVVMPNGDLIAGGAFSTPPTSSGPGVVARLARWTGTAWAPFAGDVAGGAGGGVVNDLLVAANGDLVVTGGFATAGSVPAANIARWNGTTWSAFGSGLDAGGTCLCERSNGDIVVGGQFATAGGTPADRLARWNGTSWSAIGSPNPGASIETLTLDATTGAVLAGGSFTSVGGVAANCIAAWDGSSWSAFTTGVGGWVPFAGTSVLCIQRLGNGHVAAGGAFTTAGSGPAQHFAVWAGSQWLGGGSTNPGTITRLAAIGPSDVVAAGNLTIAGAAHYVGRRTNGAWVPLGSGTDGWASALLPLPNGDIVVGGMFANAGGVPCSNIARWNGTAWSPLGLGCNAAVQALARLPNGDIVAAGGFSSAGGTAANSIARWNGATWSPLGSGLAGPFGGYGQHLVAMPNGDLVVIGAFATAGGVPADNVARWNGTAWSAMGAGILGQCSGVALMPNGDLVVAGSFASGLLERWNGSTWAPLPTVPGSYVARGVAALPDGDVLAAFDDAAYGAGPWPFKRFDGVSWSEVGSANNMIGPLATNANGEVLAGGSFSAVAQAVAPNIARFASSCPALAVTGGAGCPSSGGANTLVATSLPWLGSTFATAGAGLPANALVAVVRGFAPVSIPLVSVLPQGQPGCTLHVSPDVLDVVVPTNGAATATLALPATPALVGLAFGEQWVPLDLGPGLTIVAVTSTNMLAAVLGLF